MSGLVALCAVAGLVVIGAGAVVGRAVDRERRRHAAAARRRIRAELDRRAS